MPTHLELAQLSKQVYYSNGGFLLGWKCTDFYEDQNNGLAIGVYEKESSNEMVIAFRGTDTKNLNNFMKNLFTDFEVARQKEPSTVRPAIQFVKKKRESRNSLSRLSSLILSSFKRNQLTLTGHSLGGTIAMVVYLFFAKQDKPYQVVTFEDTGIGHLMEKKDQIKWNTLFQERCITYLSHPNFVNTLHTHIGEIRHLKLNSYSDCFSKYQYYEKHIKECALSELARIIFYFSLINVIDDLFGKDYLSNSMISRLFLLLYEWLGYGENKQMMEYTSIIFMVLIFSFFLYRDFSNTNQLTAQQHPIDKLIPAFEKGKGNADYIEMETWPQAFYGGFWKKSVKRLLPFGSDTPGLRTLFWPEDMKEQELNNMDGYRIKKKN